jgi:glycosyltransferase involved in cell wall biosynthesis
MTTRAPITVLIPAGNEERHLVECISAVLWADEVLVVVDTASTDRTLQLAQQYATRVLVHPYENSAAQKNWAIPQAAHEWILVVDADERVTHELKHDIEKVLENPSALDGYRIHRINHFAGQRINGCGWQRDDVLRLFRRSRGRYEDKHVHADVISRDEVPLRVGSLRGKFLHYTFESFEQYLRKHGRYAAWAGEDRALTTKRVTLSHLAGRPAWRFFRQYVLYGGYRDGLAGFIICWMAAHSVFLKYAHVWESQREAKQRRGD